MVNQCTERHAVVPARRKVRYVHVLTHTHIQPLVTRLVVLVG